MMLVIWGKGQHRHLAASWRDGQIAYGMHEQSARRAKWVGGVVEARADHGAAIRYSFH
jgi:hypothetical protein